jgi:hypothetical protein
MTMGKAIQQLESLYADRLAARTYQAAKIARQP